MSSQCVWVTQSTHRLPCLSLPHGFTACTPCFTTVNICLFPGEHPTLPRLHAYTPLNFKIYIQTGVGVCSHSCEGSMIRKPKQHNFNLSGFHGCTTCTPWFTTVNVGLILGKYGRVPHSTHQCNNVRTHLHTNRGGGLLSQLRRQYDQKAKTAQLQSVSFPWMYHLHTMVYHDEHRPHPR
ncbi:hypothetical protein Cgig2_022863 [Carnegiea gigantea]|uniref:Uncharacterized protein n=1 Tax=Carnegiea gigantea TaxID=171969 RepID=A0A9Q1QMD7_9CARY|nr:hypothetical protein Cgig2_022863 [Carnegiea gigantea]